MFTLEAAISPYAARPLSGLKEVIAMAFDKRRQRTFKELERLTKQPRYMKSSYNPYDGIFVRFGRFYATNGYIMVYCEWPELLHCGKDEWLEVACYDDDEGNHMQIPGFMPVERNLQNDAFERFYWMQNDFDPFTFNPRLMKDAMKIFEINGINPIWSCNNHQFGFSGHNDDVSINMVMVGCK